MLPFYVQEAARLSSEYGTRDPERIAAEMGISVLRLPMGGIYGAAVSVGGYRLIGVNCYLLDLEQKLVIAHELGHFVLHPNGSVFILTKTQFYTKLEYQANMFAVALLAGLDWCEFVKELAACGSDKLILLARELK